MAVRKKVQLRPEKCHLTVSARTLPQYVKEQDLDGSWTSKAPEMALSAQVWLWVGTACQKGLASPVGLLMSLGWGKWGQAGWEGAGCLLGVCAG